MTAAAPPTPKRAIVALPATMLLDLLKQAAAICGCPFPADVRLVTVEYRVETEELRMVVESEESPLVPSGGEFCVVFSPFLGAPWRR